VRPGRPSHTAEGVAAIRALEARAPLAGRVLDDPLAVRFLGPGFRLRLALAGTPLLREAVLSFYERRVPGIMGYVLCRSRFIDEALGAALADGVEQIVVFGAGFDSRAHRTPGIDRCRVFEVDHPDTQACKRARLRRWLRAEPAHVTYIPLDLSSGDPGEALRAAGFRASARTFFICEAVAEYLDRGAAGRIFACAGQAAPGSRLVFTYALADSVPGGGDTPAGSTWRYLARRGEAVRFQLAAAEVPALLAVHGLRLREDLGQAELRARYVPAGRRLPVAPYARVAASEVLVRPAGQ
jgi:methyltransferase (TIGR00027 family)